MQRTFKPFTNGSNADVNAYGRVSEPLELDAVIVGGGFSGVYLLHRLRQTGFKVKIVEAGSALGGVWCDHRVQFNNLRRKQQTNQVGGRHWNTYPGARVDSQWPVYQLSIPNVYSDFQWEEQYPGASELQRYFRHTDKVLDISKDTIYNTRVERAVWDEEARRWKVTCNTGLKIRARFFNCCLGFAANRYLPDWPGQETFEGYLCHSSFWPQESVNMRGKRVGCIGSGATGIRIAQESAKQAEHLTVFVRTPNSCIPMNQNLVDPEQAKKDLVEYIPRIMKDRYRTNGGYLYANPTQKVMETPKEERDAILEAAWKHGGFFILFTFTDIAIDKEANRYVYDFWASKVRPRISDPVKRDILAPLEPPHVFGGKRPSLEQDYYEQMDKKHVTIVDLKKTPIERFVPEGIVTSDGQLHQLDILALATGFDSVTGGFTQIDIRGIDGRSLKDYWSGEQGALSYLGLAVNGFPNMFYTYGPHAPTAYANGPSTVEPQCEWILETMNRMSKNGQTKIHVQPQAEQAWKKHVNEVHAMFLRDQVDSWYLGANIPGKPRQALNYSGDLAFYVDTICEKLEKNWEGFDVV